MYMKAGVCLYNVATLLTQTMKRVILIGFMGAGKTTLGRVLAREMGLMFYDLDVYIEERFHKTIPAIFEEVGEDGFRDIERRMLHEVAEFEDVVISCGGGTPCFFDNMDYLNAQGDTFYLKASPEVLKAHLLMGKTQRPLIKGKTPDELIDYIKQALQQRSAFYEKAKHTIELDVINTSEDIIGYVKNIMSQL